jgi:hypothetical protein
VIDFGYDICVARAQIRMARLGKRLTVAVICLLGSFAAGQDDPVKQTAIDQIRRVANAIKQCPEQMSSYQDECKVHYSYAGPPGNVEWDVLPSKTVRSLFQGIIEFTLPLRSQDIDRANQSKKVHQKCADRETTMAAMAALAAPALAEAAKEGPKWREGHYRYEFDVGPDAPELIKMLWVVKDKDNNTVTSAANTVEHECWVKAAKSAGSNKTENTSSSPKP